MTSDLAINYENSEGQKKPETSHLLAFVLSYLSDFHGENPFS